LRINSKVKVSLTTEMWAVNKFQDIGLMQFYPSAEARELIRLHLKCELTKDERKKEMKLQGKFLTAQLGLYVAALSTNAEKIEFFKGMLLKEG
jgi:hypothetical protein